MNPQLVILSMVMWASIASAMNENEPIEIVMWPRLTVSVAVPPARFYVEDEAGRRSGVDPALAVDAQGIGTEIQQIPRSLVDPINIGSDDPVKEGAPQAQTQWAVLIPSRAPQTYVVTFHGMVSGVVDVRLRNSCTEVTPFRDDNRIVNVLVSPGLVRKLHVTFNPEGGVPPVAREVHREDLPLTVAAACSATLITPEGVCQSLKAKAEAAAKALRKGRTRAARGAVKAFLNELEAQGGKHVQEPALTILREEAEALLNPPPTRKLKKHTSTKSTQGGTR